MIVSTASVLIGVAFSALAFAETAAESVVVIRGAEVSHQSAGVIVMRPAQGSFLCETTRLADQADAREERAAAERARNTDLRVAQALEALASSAYEAQSRLDNDYAYVWVMNAQRIPARENKTLPPVAPFTARSPPQ